MLVRGHVGDLARGINIPERTAGSAGLDSVNPIFTLARIRIDGLVQSDNHAARSVARSHESGFSVYGTLDETLWLRPTAHLFTRNA
jgi:hypothetical protein